ncbi:MAG: pantoate--beta-alanine ligase [Cognaticolwellia sp.]|jgi:pantoate--beta-alanine ligase
MRLVTETAAMQAQGLAWRGEGQRVGFVPTMGFLHAGHTSLMDLAREQCDVLVASIFVNPTQFGPNEDLGKYPRDPQGDAAKCQAHGVDLLFMPSDFYPPNYVTSVRVAQITEGLCGVGRPEHFGGVTSVVARLFGVVQPSVAVFGEKDFQQLAVIRRMVRDLAMPVEILGGPLVRQADGLAMSSRNVNLSEANRRRALSLSAALRGLRDGVQSGERDVAKLLALARERLDCDQLEYLDLRDGNDLEVLSELRAPARAFVAARYGGTRLIDNLSVL